MEEANELPMAAAAIRPKFFRFNFQRLDDIVLAKVDVFSGSWR